MAYSGQSGLAIGLVYDQALVWARGFGYANVEAHAATTPQTTPGNCPGPRDAVDLRESGPGPVQQVKVGEASFYPQAEW